MNIIKQIMPKAQYVSTKTSKTKIILHHTAGGHNPEWVIDGWEANPERVGTHYVIGGKSTSNGDVTFDGKIYQAVPEENFIYHLGTNGATDKISIGIEVCNYGPLVLKNGVYLNYVFKPVPANDVVDLGFVWRGYRYWHKYTDTQLESLKELILDISKRYNISVKKVWDVKSFDTSVVFQKDGLTTHTNFRKDKFDLCPQPNLIKMLNSL